MDCFNLALQCASRKDFAYYAYSDKNYVNHLIDESGLSPYPAKRGAVNGSLRQSRRTAMQNGQSWQC
jgi:hypothetical protein